MVVSTFLQPPTASISTHILDISLGRPAEGVTILAYVEEGGQWKLIGNRSTTADGRVPWVSPNVALTRANYKLQFMIGNYYQKLGIETFYPYIEVVFTITNAAQHYHVPLTLSPYGYSTYRGS
ncbi:unnamed protein product [Angiostrongylus costaricensis]|uniref:5-hydroxyisourate hydrolase n=1 Tax=Angiostrongylus costaricensis TaxID=334426 RepID=A0A0R3Q0U4_ANGCS|nr:unnamed protein product [Angiostrongylus costaricensis]